MANTYTLIASSTVGLLGAASIDFTSIPSTYTDLLLKVSARDSTAASRGAFSIRFNGSSAFNYSMKELRDVDGTASSTGVTGQSEIDGGRTVGTTATASTFGNVEIYVPNYAGSTAKSASIDNVLENNSTTYYSNLTAGLWSLTNAITQVTLTCTGSFVQYSTAYLYGIKNS